MSIVPPWPGILDTLRGTLRELREFAEKNPNEPVLTEAIADIERAVGRLQALAGENNTAT
jgi:hypothetical protein